MSLINLQTSKSFKFDGSWTAHVFHPLFMFYLLFNSNFIPTRVQIFIDWKYGTFHYTRTYGHQRIGWEYNLILCKRVTKWLVWVRVINFWELASPSHLVANSSPGDSNYVRSHKLGTQYSKSRIDLVTRESESMYTAMQKCYCCIHILLIVVVWSTWVLTTGRPRYFSQ